MNKFEDGDVNELLASADILIQILFGIQFFVCICISFKIVTEWLQCFGNHLQYEEDDVIYRFIYYNPTFQIIDRSKHILYLFYTILLSS